MQPDVAGVDICKDRLDVSLHPGGQRCALPNRRQAINAWLKALPPQTLIGVESTGTCHWMLVELAIHRGFTVYLVDPRRTRAFAQSLGYRGKSDRIDADAIAQFVVQMHPKLHPYRLPTRLQRRIDTLLRRRAKLVTMRQQLVQVTRGMGAERAMAKTIGERMNALIKHIERVLKQLVDSEPVLARTTGQLRTIPGSGPCFSQAYANLFTRVPLQTGDAAVAFTGLDPRPNDSGKSRGRRKLSKQGPAELRRLAYMAAMAACKTPLWKPLYQRDIARGLTTTEALVVLARRLVRIAWALVRTRQDFDPARVRAC